jgi:gallate decarboxylase subunit D
MQDIQFQVATEEECYNLGAFVRQVGSDWLVCITGGDQPHIGAVAAAQSRPSLKRENAISATASVFCFLGHKDDTIAKNVSEELAASLNAKVVVTAGIHWDDISPDGILKILENSRILTQKIEAGISGRRKDCRRRE